MIKKIFIKVLLFKAVVFCLSICVFANTTHAVSSLRPALRSSPDSEEAIEMLKRQKGSKAEQRERETIAIGQGLKLADELKTAGQNYLQDEKIGYYRIVKTITIRGKPLDVILDERINPDLVEPQKYIEPKPEEAYKIGAYADIALSRGTVGLITVAGGVSSRAGLSYPKGMSPITPISGKTLFETRAEELIAAREYYKKSVVWFIMTSELTDEATRKYFSEKKYFGLGKKNIIFIRQENVPVFEAGSQNLAMKDKDMIMSTANGHGGIYKAMRDVNVRTDGGRISALEEARRRGIKHFIYCQVDNPLPAINRTVLGYHIKIKSDFTATAIRKRDPMEGLAMMAADKVTKQKFFVEYNQPAAEVIREKQDFELGSISRFFFSYDFLERATQPPYHIVRNKKAKIFKDGRIQNGLIDKLECFSLEALSEARRSLNIVMPREECFAPFKEMEGPDSPEMVAKAISNYWKRLIKKVFPGIEIPESTIIEMPWSANFMTEEELKKKLISIDVLSKLKENTRLEVSFNNISDEIIFAANILSQQKANVVFEMNSRLNRWIFRRGNIEIRAPPAVSNALGRKMEVAGKKAILFNFRSQSADATTEALREALFGIKSIEESFTKNGISNSFDFKKVLLIPPYGDREGRPLKYVMPHYGVETVSFRLLRETENVDARVYNPNLGSVQELYKFIQQENFDVIGFSLLMLTLKESLKMIGAAHTLSPRSLIVLGGNDLWSFPIEDFFAALPCDVCVFDEGTAFLKIVSALSSPLKMPPEQQLVGIFNIAFRGNKGVIYTAQANIQKVDLDIREDIPLKEADVTHRKAYHYLDSDSGATFIAKDRIGRSPLPISYGNLCAGKCIFCSIEKNTHYPPPAEEIISIINRHHEKYDSINFDSADFLADFAKAQRLFRLLGDSPFASMPKKITTRVNSIGDGDILRDMYLAGVKLVAYGVESFSSDITRKVGKGTTREQNIRAIELTLQAGITPGINLIMFTPWDTIETTMETISQAVTFVERGAYVNVVPYVNIIYGTPISRMHHLIDYHTYYFKGMSKKLKIPYQAKVLDIKLRKLAPKALEIEKDLEKDYPPIFANTVAVYSLFLFKAFYLAYAESYGYNDAVIKEIAQIDFVIEKTIAEMTETVITGQVIPFRYRDYRNISIPDNSESSSLHMEEYIAGKFPEEIMNAIKQGLYSIEIHRGPQSRTDRHITYLRSQGYDVAVISTGMPRIRNYYRITKGEERFYIISNNIGYNRELFVAQVLKFYNYDEECVAVRSFPFDLRNNLLKQLAGYAGKIDKVILVHEIDKMAETSIKKIDPAAEIINIFRGDFIYGKVIKLSNGKMALICDIEYINGEQIKPVLEFFSNPVNRRGMGVNEIDLYAACGSLSEDVKINDILIPSSAYRYGKKVNGVFFNPVEKTELNKFKTQGVDIYNAPFFTVPTVLSSSRAMMRSFQEKQKGGAIELEFAHAAKTMQRYPNVIFRAIYEVHDKPVDLSSRDKKDAIGEDVPGMRNEERRKENTEGVLRYLFCKWDAESALERDASEIGVAVTKLPKVVFAVDALISEATKRVEQASKKNPLKTIIVGIGGVTGTGKSRYLTPKLIEAVKRKVGKNTCVIRGDRFVLSKENRLEKAPYPENLFDLKMINVIMNAAMAGQKIGFPIYDPNLRRRPFLNREEISALQSKGLISVSVPYYKKPLILLGDNYKEHKKLLGNPDSELAVDRDTGEFVEVVDTTKKVVFFEVTLALFFPELRRFYDFSIFLWANLETRRHFLKLARNRQERFLQYDQSTIDKRLLKMRQEEDPVVLRTAEYADTVFINEVNENSIGGLRKVAREGDRLRVEKTPKNFSRSDI